MEAKRDNIIRPLLCLKREEIEEYLEQSGQKYRTDETNNAIEYSRNYIRKKIIPKFENVRQNAVEHINALSGEAADINDFMEKKALELLEEASKEADRKYITKGLTTKYKSDILSGAEPILLKFAVRALITEAGVSIKDVTRNHVDALCEMIAKPKSGEIHLPKGVTVVKESGIVYIKPREDLSHRYRKLLTFPRLLCRLSVRVLQMNLIKSRIPLINSIIRSSEKETICSPMAVWFRAEFSMNLTKARFRKIPIRNGWIMLKCRKICALERASRVIFSLSTKTVTKGI